MQNLQHNQTQIYEPLTSLAIGAAVVDVMNEAIAQSSAEAVKCAPLTLDVARTAKATLIEFMPQSDRRIFRADLYIQPSGGYYNAYAEVSVCVFSLFFLCNDTKLKITNVAHTIFVLG